VLSLSIHVKLNKSNLTVYKHTYIYMKKTTDYINKLDQQVIFIVETFHVKLGKQKNKQDKIAE